MTGRKQDSFWLGFDLGGTKMMAAIYDCRFKLLGCARKKTKGAEGFPAGFARMVETVEEALAEAGIRRPRISAMGVGSPGPLDLDRGIILQAPNLGWRNAPLKRRLEAYLGRPVVIANDVDAGTFGEYAFGAARGARCAVGIFPGTGIGGACVYEGRIIRGRTNSCMEIGHMIVNAGGRLCGCGRRGCLEAEASRLAIAAEAAVAASRGRAPHLLRLAGTDLKEIRSGALAEAIRMGDQAIEDIVRFAARRIGFAAAGIVNLLAPDVVVLGGGLVEQMPDIYLQEVRSGIRNGAMESLAAHVRCVAAKLGDYATVMGAAALAAGLDKTANA